MKGLNCTFKVVLIIFACCIMSDPCMAASFDCSKASSPIEKLVCSDSILSDLDSRLGLAFREARSNTLDKEGLKRAQFAWLAQLKNCPDTQCLRLAYEKRVGELVQMGASPPTGSSSVSPAPSVVSNGSTPGDESLRSGRLAARQASAIGKGYEGLFVQYLRANPQAMSDRNVQLWWADLKFRQEFRQYVNQEFKMAALCERAKEDMADTVNSSDQGAVDVVVKVAFREYNFQNQCFPVNVGKSDITMSNPNSSVGTPRIFVMRLDGLDAANCLYLNRNSAQDFLQKHMDAHGRGNRDVLLLLRVKVDSSLLDQLKNKAMSEQPMLARLESVTFLEPSRDGRNAPEVIATVSSSQMASLLEERARQKAETDRAEAERREQLKKAEAERLAQWKMEQAKASREHDIAALGARPLQVRLANVLSSGPVNLDLTLANLRAARFRSLIQGKPVSVAMLIQADASGKTEVPTKWPGLLQVTAPDGIEFKSSAWYLVKGMISTTEGDGLPPSNLVATDAIPCAKDYCQDLGDATAIVDAKLSAAFGGKQ